MLLLLFGEKTKSRSKIRTVSTPDNLLRETHHFYKSPYSAKLHNETVYAAILNIKTPTLSVDDRNSCEGQFNKHKLLQAVNAMEKTSRQILMASGQKFLQTLLGNPWHQTVMSLQSRSQSCLPFSHATLWNY